MVDMLHVFNLVMLSRQHLQSKKNLLVADQTISRSSWPKTSQFQEISRGGICFLTFILVTIRAMFDVDV